MQAAWKALEAAQAAVLVYPQFISIIRDRAADVRV
eukprot:COSAG06_NODE_8714_length_2090_cov_1.725264_1_plen_34_part_10